MLEDETTPPAVETSRRVRWSMWIVASLLVVWALFNHAQISAAQEQNALARGAQTTASVAAHIDRAVLRLQGAVHTFAEDMRRAEGMDVVAEVTRRSMQHGFVFTVCFEPHAWDPSRRLFCPSYDPVSQRAFHIEDSYDYTADEEQSLWYSEAIVRDGPGWSTPYWGNAGKALFTDYAVPIDLDPDRDGHEGIVVGSFTSKGLDALMHQLELGSAGYGMVVSDTGRLVVHPDQGLVADGTALGQLVERERYRGMAPLLPALDAADRGVVDVVDPTRERDAWVFHDRVPSNGWHVALLFDRQYLVGHSHRGNRALLTVVFALALLLLVVVSDVRLSGREPLRRLWTLSFAATAILLCCTAAMWAVEVLRFAAPGPHVATPPQTSELLNEQRTRLERRGAPPPVVVPTGVLVRHVHFEGAFEVEVSGHIWQTYAVDSPLERTVLLPELAPDAESFDLTETYRTVEGEVELVGWFFRARLRQGFDVTKYPFDHRDVQLVIAHPSIDRRVMLVPDYAAYAVTNPSALPGVVRDMPSPGWTMERSLFEHALVPYATTFGTHDRAAMEARPELRFHMIMRRQVMGPVIMRIVPVFAIAAMLFGVQLITSRRRERSELSGFSTVGALESCAAFFFVVIVSHIDLRSQIETGRLFYLENFYFATYAAILWVGVNSLLLTEVDASRVRWVHAHDNLWPKLCFGPAFAGLVFLLTAIDFY